VTQAAYVRIGAQIVREAAGRSGKAPSAQERLLLVSEEPLYVAASAHESFTFEAAISIITEELDRLHSDVTFFDEREFDDTNASG
jgi:hypothetical protein